MNTETGEITIDAVDEVIRNAKESRGKKIDSPPRDNAFGAAFQMIDEYKRVNGG